MQYEKALPKKTVVLEGSSDYAQRVELVSISHVQHAIIVLSSIAAPKVVLDVGANISFTGLLMDQMVEGADIWCFELHPKTFAQLSANLETNKTGLNTFHPMGTALGKKKDELPFRDIDLYNTGNSLLIKDSLASPGTRRVVVAMRERTGRTLPFIAMNEGEGVALAIENVSRTATMSADEAAHWDTLHDGWMVDRVNHSEIYSDHGKHTNMVESFFSRLRNMIQGQHHGVSPKYLHQYANHSAWLEDNRRTDNGTLAHIVVSNAMGAPVSRNWKGYWQRVV